MPLLKQSTHPKVLQVTSRFHMATDGSDLSTKGGMQNPIASEVGGSHGFFFFRTQRQYANSKLAQILHAHALQERYQIRAVSACPTWVGTQIGGAKNGTVTHSLLEALGFPMDGFGLSSILHALLDNENKGDFYVNTDLFAEEPNLLNLLPSWTYQWLPIRDTILGGGAFTFVILLQRFFATRKLGRSSIQSYDKNLENELYEWSRQAVYQWL